MDEKILMKSTTGNIWTRLFIPMAAVITVVYSAYLYFCEPYYGSFWRLYLSPYGLILCGLLLIPVFVCVAIGNCEIVVTEKRVYGKAIFKKRVELPIDSISAVGTSWFKGIAIATASGSISFVQITNNEEIHICISNLLMERQNKPASNTVIKQEISQSNADELKKFKDLLDSGVITQDEFNAKKQQLLGL